MKHKHRYVLPLLAVMLTGQAAGQHITPLSTRELAPGFGLRPDLIDDTATAGRYLDSIGASTSALADTCVAINARVLAFGNSLRHDYQMKGDTLWINPTQYLDDYDLYKVRLETLSTMLLGRAKALIYHRNRHRQEELENELGRLRDTIDRLHRLIVNTTDGIGVKDKDRQKELKDIFYAYLSVYNRYDFSMRQGDSLYKAGLDQFCQFQHSLIDNLLGNDNLQNRIRLFPQELKARCTATNTDVFRSYQRSFRQPMPAASFSTIEGYNNYIAALKNHLKTQRFYLDAIGLREQIEATGKKIVSLYYPKFRPTAQAYQEAAEAAVGTPAFSTIEEGTRFIGGMEEFVAVQGRYMQDYVRLIDIIAHSDSIVKRCGFKYTDVAKAYRNLNSQYLLTPSYRTLVEADKFAGELTHFETMQRQYDSIVAYRRLIDEIRDTIGRNWMGHATLFNGLQQLRKQTALTPAFISVADGKRFIDGLGLFVYASKQGLAALHAYENYKTLDRQVAQSSEQRGNIKKAYRHAERYYLSTDKIATCADMETYLLQLNAFASVQRAFLKLLGSPEAAEADGRLRNVKDINQIETLIGL